MAASKRASESPIYQGHLACGSKRSSSCRAFARSPGRHTVCGASRSCAGYRVNGKGSTSQRMARYAWKGKQRYGRRLRKHDWQGGRCHHRRWSCSLMKDHLTSLTEKPDVITCAGATDSDFLQLKTIHGLLMPIPHEEILRKSNGLAVFSGYFRLFGIKTRTCVDALWWNDPNCWKFAWSDRCQNYWCFGETAWGDQYAYRIDNLSRGEYSVYFLDALSMTAEKIASNFEEFFEKEFIRNANQPYDGMIIKAQESLGPLDSESLLVYTPSLLLGGNEDLQNVQTMNARAAMICNGDIALQLQNAPRHGEVSGV